MNPEIARSIDPLIEAVETAQHDLNHINTDHEAHPLDALAYAGNVIKAHQKLNDRMYELLDTLPPHTPDEWRNIQMLIQGRLNEIRKT